MNRRLIRPTLSEVQDQLGSRLQRKKPTPPEQTNAESFYYLKQMQARTPRPITQEKGTRQPSKGEKIIMVDAALHAIEELMRQHEECLFYGQDVGRRSEEHT